MIQLIAEDKTLIRTFSSTINLAFAASLCRAASPPRRFTASPPPPCAGGASRNRTDDIQLAKLALYQLSYGPSTRLPSVHLDWWA